MTTEARPRALTIALPEFFTLGRTRVLSVPSGNVFVAWNRARAFYRFKELKRLYCLHILAAQSEERWGAPADRVEIEVVRRCCRLFDDDNLISGAKYLRDSLVRMGIVVDDTPAHVSLVARQEKAKTGQRGVTVTVREVG